MPTRFLETVKREIPWSYVLTHLMLSALCSVMVIYRFAVTGRTTYAWLVVPNLVLAWMPLGFALCIRVAHAQGWRHPALLGSLGLLWLAFFPNAPYIVTDIVHIAYVKEPISMYFDIALVAGAAWTGLSLGMVSLAVLQRLVEERSGRWVGWSFASVACLLSSVGISLGRIERWNSWDIVRSPARILTDALGNLHGEPLLIIVVFTALTFALYAGFRSSARSV